MRLLHLLPGTRQDDIDCKLETVSVEDVVDPYEALSYVWGDVSARTPIQINGNTLQIGKNLRSALLNLRLVAEWRTLWIDAVCIDQGNIHERERQVAVMGNTYRSAAATIVWLGDSQPEFTVVAYHTVRTLAGLSGEAASQSKDGTSLQAGKDIVFQWLKDDTSVPIDLLGRDWWRRAWTAQEIILAKKGVLVCGRYQIDWGLFCDAVAHGLALEVWEPIELGTFVPQHFVFFHAIQTLRSLSVEGNPAGTTLAGNLVDLLVQTRRRDATDARDKLFAVLGLLQADASRLEIQPDYSSSAADVYRSVSANLIEHSGALDVLGACFPWGDDPAALKGLPSWVPDWRPTGISAQPLLYDQTGQRRETHATRNSTCRPIFADGGSTLVVEGHHLSGISAVSSILPEFDDSAINMRDDDYDIDENMGMRKTAAQMGRLVGSFVSGAADYFGAVVPHLAIYVEWERFARDLRPTNRDNPKAAGDDAMAIYWQTLCAGSLAPGGYDETEALFWEWHKTLGPIRSLMKWKVDEASATFKTLGMLGYLKSTWKGYGAFFSLLRQCTERRMGGTAEGYLCLLPKAAQVGDELMLVKGSRIPLVLRQRDDGCISSIGEAYVHGSMDGDAFDETLCREIRIR